MHVCVLLLVSKMPPTNFRCLEGARLLGKISDLLLGSGLKLTEAGHCGCDLEPRIYLPSRIRPLLTMCSGV